MTQVVLQCTCQHASGQIVIVEILFALSGRLFTHFQVSMEVEFDVPQHQDQDQDQEIFVGLKLILI